MTKSREEMLAEAAEEFVFVEICYEGLEFSPSGNTAKECVRSFKAGAKWADSNVHPDTQMLVDALKKILQGDEVLNDGLIARKALKKWKARGK